MIIFLVSLLSIFIVVLTNYSKMNKGQKILLGSFFIIKNIKSLSLKVVNIKPSILMFLRLLFVIAIVLILLNPSVIEDTDRKIFFNEPIDIISSSEKYEYNLTLLEYVSPVDTFDEDLYFINSLVKSYGKIKRKTGIVMGNGLSKYIGSDYDLIYFPTLNTEIENLSKFSNKFYFLGFQHKKNKIQEKNITVNAFYPIVVNDSSNVKTLIKLSDGTPVGITFKILEQRIFIMGIGLESRWGDFGISGAFVEAVSLFIYGNKEKKQLLQKNNNELIKTKVSYKFSVLFLLQVATLFLILESLFFVFKVIFPKSMIIVLIFCILPLNVFAQKFRFIELVKDKSDTSLIESKKMFMIIKKTLDEKTSIDIDDKYYSTFSFNDLEKSIMPDIPFLWFLEPFKGIVFSQKTVKELKKFGSRGGVVFIDSSGNNDEVFNYSIEQLGNLYTGSINSFQVLDKNHPIYKSFYLLSPKNLKGISASATSGRYVLIYSRNNLKNRILQNDKEAIKTLVNVTMYMLSGNYKNDQIHVRHILDRIKKRELFK